MKTSDPNAALYASAMYSPQQYAMQMETICDTLSTTFHCIYAFS